MKTKRQSGVSGNFFTGSGRGTLAGVRAQSIHTLLADTDHRMLALLARRGYQPAKGFTSPVFKIAGTNKDGFKIYEQPSHATDPAAHFAEMALLLCARTSAALKAKDWSRAAEYAYLCGEYRAKAYMHSRKAAVSRKGKRAHSDNTAQRDADIVARAEAKLREHRGNASVKDLHRHLGLQLSLPRFDEILKRGGLGKAARGKIRENFLAKR